MKQLFFRYEKYLPYTDYDVNSVEEIMSVIKKQTQLIENRGLILTQHFSSWTPNNEKVNVNKIYQDKLTPYHDHDYYEINCVLEDSLVQYIEGNELVMKKGDLLIIPPGVRHCSFPVGQNSNSFNILILSEFITKTEAMLREINSSNYLNLLMKHKTYILFVNTHEQGIDNMINECIYYQSNKTPFSNLLKYNIAEKLLLTLTDCERYDQIFKDTNRDADLKDRGERILQYMYEHYTNITLETLADKFGYSTQHIRRIIKKHTGLSFITALQQKRLSMAMHLLSTTELSVKEISDMVGLESPEYFARRFKYERGMTPTQYRNKNRGQTV